MARTTKTGDILRRPPAMEPEDREKQLINLAVNLAEKKLRDGTASTPIIVHYLKLASPQHFTEREILERQRDLITAKTDSIRAEQHREEIYSEAIAAMMDYKPESSNDEDV